MFFKRHDKVTCCKLKEITSILPQNLPQIPVVDQSAKWTGMFKLINHQMDKLERENLSITCISYFAVVEVTVI